MTYGGLKFEYCEHSQSDGQMKRGLSDSKESQWKACQVDAYNKALIHYNTPLPKKLDDVIKPGGGNNNSGGNNPTSPTTPPPNENGMGTGAKIGIGAGIVAILGTIIYFITKK